MKRLFGFGLLASSVLLSQVFAAEATLSNKEALQEFNSLIGQWNGIGGGGTPERPKAEPKTWKETIEWGWKFKDGDGWMTFNVKNGKYLKSGELSYLPAKKMYQMKAKDIKDRDLVFEGKFEKGYLTLERTDPTSKETQQIKMNLAGDGIRFIFRYSVKPAGRTLYTAEYHVTASKEGESLGTKAVANKDRECIISGGLGTMQVSFGGKSYWVCCSGCRDEFNADPAKYVKEFEAKKKAGK
jgi:hypothetical protein